MKKPTIVYEAIEGNKQVSKDIYGLIESVKELETKTEIWLASPQRRPQPSILLTKGIHYKIETDSMLQYAYRWIRKEGYNQYVQTSRSENSIRIIWRLEDA